MARVLGDAGKVGEGTDVVITEMEHHSNIVPWQLLTERTGATLRWFGITDEGRLDLDQLEQLITERTAVVSLTWVSNMLGTINPLETVIKRAQTWVRWSSSTPHRRCRSSPSTSRHWVPTSSPSPATRWSGPPASACCGAVRPAGRAPALPRRRRDDRDRHDGALHVRPAALAVRGRHPADRPGRRAGRRGRLPQRDRHAQRRGSSSARSPRTRSNACRRSTASASSARRMPRCVGEPSASALDGVDPHDVAQLLDSGG